MNLSTTYLGFKFRHPIMVAASPLADDLDMVKRLEDAGAVAIVMRSLFEEQILAEQLATVEALDGHANSFAEAIDHFPNPPNFKLGPESYLEQLRRVKEAVDIPVFGSLNGVTPGGWVNYAHQMEQAGADALELNVYDLALDPSESAASIETRLRTLVREVRYQVKIPLAVKLSPFFTALPNLAAQLVEAGANALVLFNRLYQPDIDLEELEVVRVHLSDSSELPLRLRWLAILSGRINASLAISGGVHSSEDALKAVMAGADAVQVVSAVLRDGPSRVAVIRDGMADWLVEHEYDSLGQAKGSMSMRNFGDPAAYARVNYMRVLHSWHG